MSRKIGIVNVMMVITEEKILSNIDKINKMINPNAKKQIVQLEEDGYFKDLIESIKTYLTEYPKKTPFPRSVYKAAYELVEYATNQFEENTKQIEDLIRQREGNFALANKLRGALEEAEGKTETWKEQVKALTDVFDEDIVNTLLLIGRCRVKKTENYENAVKLINARISNLDSNLHIEIDMERIEDRSKALSYIGIEVAEALKEIPESIVENTGPVTIQDSEDYVEQTTFEVKPTLWQRIKSTKVLRALRTLFKIRITIDVPALGEGRGDNN